MATKKFKPSGLLAQIDEHITSPLKLDSRAKHLYPTGASCVGEDDQLRGSCSRAVAYDYMGINKTNDFTPETMYTFAMGKKVEDMVVEWTKEMGIFAARNIKFFDPYFHLSGELDIVLRESPGSEILYGVECKSSHGNYFKTEVITGKAGKPPAPKDDHIMQVMMYLSNFPTLKYFILVYIGRDEFARTEYIIRLVQVDNDWYPEITHGDFSKIDMNFSLSRIYNRYVDTLRNIKKGILPARDYKPVMTQEEMDIELSTGRLYKSQMKKFQDGEIMTAHWRCRYCSFKSLCRSMPEGPVDNFIKRFDEQEWNLA